MGMHGEPRVSIGVPVYNGARFLRAQLDSLLGQTFEDFECLLVDNASTDETPEICREYAKRDPRVRFHRNETNLGGPANYRRALALARGGYFKWAAHDDIHEPDFLRRCVEVLETRPDVVLVHSQVRVVDGQGRLLRLYEGEMRHLESARPADRFGDLVLIPHKCFEHFGLMRRGVLVRAPLGSYFAADRVQLAELALHGKFVILPEPLFVSRKHEDRSVTLRPHERAIRWWGQAGEGQIVFPYWRIALELWRAIHRAPLSPRERLACHRPWLTWIRRNGKYLRGDLRLAIARTAGRRELAGDTHG